MLLMVLGGSLVALQGCGPAVDEVAEAAATVTVPPSVTPARFVPTITPIPSPTELLPVTPPTAAPTPTISPAATLDPNVASVIMTPNLGELGQEIRITAQGYVPNSSVDLYWTPPVTAPGGTPDLSVEADEEGAFAVTLDVPLDWPNGPPAEHEALQLHALGVEGRAAWAAYTFVPLFEEFVAPGGTYTNETYGYALDLLPEWIADDSNGANVGFGSPDGPAGSFVRVVENATVDEVVTQVMEEVAPGAAFVSEETLLATEQATRISVSDSGLVYWFAAHSGRTYVVHFVADDPADAAFTVSTFRFTS